MGSSPNLAGITNHGRNTSVSQRATNGINLQSQKSTRLLILLLISSHMNKETTLGTMLSTTNLMRLSSWTTLRLSTPTILRTSNLLPSITLEKEEPVLLLRMKFEQFTKNE